MKQLKALDILYAMIDSSNESPLLNKNNYEKLTFIAESIDELEQLNDKSCNDCKHLKEKQLALKYSCIFEVCRTCCRNNNDKWEL